MTMEAEESTLLKFVTGKRLVKNTEEKQPLLRAIAKQRLVKAV